VPVEFLTDDHLRRYARYNNDPSPEQLAQYFTLTEADRTLIALRTNESRTRFGMAVQLCSLRFLSTILKDFQNVPNVVLQTIARQLGITDTRVLREYGTQAKTRQKHARLIREHLGYKDFTGIEVLHLVRWLYAKLLVGDERPIVLFDLTTRKLEQRNVILPGASTLARLIVRVRKRVSEVLHRDLARKLNIEQIQRLEELLMVPEGARLSTLERLRLPPTRFNTPALLHALNRLEQIRALGVGEIDLRYVPESRLWSLSRHALVAWAQTIAKLGTHRRQATLLAVVQYLERSATDDALDVFDTLMNSLGVKSERKWRKERLRNLRDLDASALLLRDAVRILFDAAVPDEKVRATVFARYSEATLLDADTHVTELASEPGEEETQAWLNASSEVSRFIPPLLSVLSFNGTPAAKALLAAVNFIVINGSKTNASWAKAPRDFIPKTWQAQVLRHGVLNRPAYLICVALQLRQALKRREIFVTRSHRFGDPRAQLLQGVAWDQVQTEVLRSLDLTINPQDLIDRLSTELHAAYQSVGQNLEGNAHVRFEDDDGVLTPIITPLEALPESEAFKVLDANVTSRLPDIDLAELLLEIDARSGFITEMLTVAESQPRRDDFMISVCAVLVSQACNIGLRAVAQPNHPALNLARLAWVQQSYVRADTLVRANAKLVEQQASLELAQRWGGGEVASADGLRFVVPVRSIHTGSNSKYFGSGRGITYYTLTSDHFTMLHGIVVPGTLRDSLYILSTLLEQQTSLEPKEIMSDTAGYSDVVFGLFRLLGYQFSPRLADVGGSRYWRFDREANYGSLNDVSKNKINTALIAQHWDDVLRVIGSLKLGTVRAPDVMRVLARDGSLSGLGKAIAEVGRAAKTLYLLAYLDDEGYRRRIHTQLNRGESRGRLARAIAHGRKGEIRQKYREGMEDQLGALGLVANAVTLWNTQYLQAGLGVVEAMGDEVLEEDVARLSPLKFAHISMLGRYHFELAEVAAAGDLRPLRDPNAIDPVELLWVD
jgi:TnpA family transposase